jgi:hypothetical protein
MSGLRKCGIHIYTYVCIYEYIHIYIYICNGILCSHRKYEIKWFEGKWVELEGITLSERLNIFSHMWKTDPLNKHIEKNDHIHIYI